MRLTPLLVSAVLAGSLSLTPAQQSSTQRDDSQTIQTPRTADDTVKSMSGADRKLTQKIRRAIVADKSLSTDAHNVKILVHDGQVTLRGQVKSEAEAKTVVDKATSEAGSAKVTSELTIRASSNGH